MMNQPRGGYRSGFSRDQIKRHKRDGSSGGGGIVPGRFDRWRPSTQHVWVSFCPTQWWKFESWNRETKQVETTEAEYFSYVEHYVGGTMKRFNCSAGPYKKEECYGCSIRHKFFENRRKHEEEFGTIPANMKDAPVSASQRFALSVTLLEEMGEYPKLDRETNAVIKSKKGRVISEWLPLRHNKTRKDGKAKAWGRRFHWSFGHDHLDALGADNAQLETKCANCAKDLTAIGWAPCVACEGVPPDWEGDIPSELLSEFKDSLPTFVCPYCDYTDGETKPELVYSCECGNPAPGSLFSFELFVGSVAEDDYTPKIYKFRPRQNHAEKYEAADEAINVPLDLPRIFVPEPLKYQLDKFDEKHHEHSTPNAHLQDLEEESPETAGLGQGEDDSSVEFLR